MEDVEWIKLKELTVGYIKDKTFYTYRKPEHFMRKYGGFGISVKILKELIERNIKDIVFIYDGSREKALFKTTTIYILGLGICEYDYTFGFDDKQFFIPLKEMEKTIIRQEDYWEWFRR